jgi:hypothetical protein
MVVVGSADCRWEWRGRHLQELKLDISTEELLSAERAFTYVDLYAMLGNQNTILWLTTRAAVARGGIRASDRMFWIQQDNSCHFIFCADGKDMFALARSPQHLLEICDVVLRLLAASVVHSLILHSLSYRDGALINAPTLAYLMEQGQSLKVLKLSRMPLDEDHCRVLGAYSRPGLEIKLNSCRLTSGGAITLAEVLGRNQGPTELTYCSIDYTVLANGLRGNSRLKSLTIRNFDHELLAIAGTLKENKGLLVCDLSCCWPSDETWYAICNSLKTHPTLQVLNLRNQTMGPFRVAPLAPAVFNSRIQALVDMLEGNMSIHAIHVRDLYSQHDLYSEHELFRGSVIPYLETNRLRPRVRAIQKKLAQLLTVPRFWDERFLLFEPMQIAFGYCYQAIRKSPFRRRLRRPRWLLTSLPLLLLSLSLLEILMLSPSKTVAASAVANAATPTACQKRKARPSPTGICQISQVRISRTRNIKIEIE